MNPITFNDLYISKGHSIQTAVAHDINCKTARGAAADSKHLRTGLNSVMCDLASLYQLLVKKEIITIDEMHEAILAGLDAEIERYEAIYPGVKFL